VSPLRILHVSPYHTQAWAYGGVPRVTGALATGLAARGHHVTVCTTDACRPDARLRRPATAARRGPWTDTEDTGVRVHVCPNLSNTLAYHQLFLPLGLGDFLAARATEFDIAHIHACRNLVGTTAARYLRRAGVPYVVSPHGTAPRIERWHAAKWLFDLSVGRRFLRDASRILAVTEAERRQLRAMRVPDDRIALIPNPIDLTQFDPPIERGAFRRRTGLGDAPVVMFLGKLTPRKRLDVLARAFARLSRPDARLVIAGNDMGFGGRLDSLTAALGIAGRTIRTGLLTGRQRLEALADADVLVYPSKDEIFGLVPIEALLCGTPVIVADDSGCGEVIDRTGGGIVVPQGDSEGLATAISSIIGNLEPWRRAARVAAEQVPPLFAAPVIGNRIEEVYLDVIRERAAAMSESRASSEY
jgi:glycosyltransferase involved in cell wall biosynthesis